MDCERERIEVRKSWESVKNLAGKRKYPPLEAAVDAVTKKQRLERWNPIENKAELLESAFATTQITWTSAAAARTDLNMRFGHIPESDDRGIPRFSAILDTANQKHQAFEQACR